MTKEIVPKKEAADAMKVIEQARQNFGSMQRSWYDFAKSVYMIRESEFYKKAGVASTFQEYVEIEFPTVSLSTMSRFMVIVEKWGESIESRLKKDENYILPAYDSCYHLASKESRIPKEDFSKLKKAVLDNKMSVSRLLDNIKEYIKKHKDKVEKEVSASYDSIEEQLTKDIQGELDVEEAEFIGDDEDDDFGTHISSSDVDFDDEEEEEDEDTDTSVESLLAKVQFLNDALPEIRSQVRSNNITKKLIKLADELNTLYSHIDEFLNKMEEASNEQTVSKAEKRA